MLQTRIIRQLSQIGRAEWNACFCDSPEDYDYLCATESAKIAGFEIFYIIAIDGDEICGCAPLFISDYDLETTLDEPWRGFLQRLKVKFPFLLRLRLCALGSPCTEDARLGIKDKSRAGEIAAVILKGFADFARLVKSTLFAIKDLRQSEMQYWQAALKAQNFTAINGMPIAILPTDFTDIEQYFTQLSHATRKDMRRKLRANAQIQTQIVSSLAPFEQKFMALYEATLARAEISFERLPFEYFENILQQMPQNSLCRLYFAGGELIGANLLLHSPSALLDKYFVMETLARKYNLYFTSWFDNIEYCIDNKIPTFIAGQAAYENKIRLGAKLMQTFMVFRHRNPIINSVLKLLSPLFAIKEGQANG